MRQEIDGHGKSMGEICYFRDSTDFQSRVFADDLR